MTHCTNLLLNELQYYATAAYPCSYINGRIARSQVAGPPEQIDALIYHELIQAGFRRSGGFIYRPHCDHCHACTSIRVLAQEFRADRSQRRALLRHKDLIVHVSKPHFSQEHYALYQRYQRARHPGGGMDQDDKAQYVEFLVNSHVDSYMVEFREESNGVQGNNLKMVSIIDQLQDSLSAVYTFYEPTGGQSYGTYNVLWQIERAKALGLTHVYLGYWIQICQKMSYKTRFQPCELLLRGKWVRLRPESSGQPAFFTR